MTVQMCSYILLILAFVASIDAAPENTCKVTQVDAYQGNDNDSSSCGTAATFKKPDPLSASNATTVTKCAGSCLDNEECLTFSWNAEGHPTCQLYKAYQEDMGIKLHPNKGYPQIYDRSCYSRDCAVIAACESTTGTNCGSDIDVFYYYTPSVPGYEKDFVYYRWFCGAGVTERARDYPTRFTTLPGNLDACEALGQCAADLYSRKHEKPDKEEGLGYFRSGSANLQYYIPTKEWVCMQYNDEPPVDFSGSLPIYGSEAGVRGRDRFTLKNSSVGTSIGIYLRYNDWFYPHSGPAAAYY